MSLSVAIITKNEEANIRRTLESVKWADEIVVVDSGSTDRTCEIAREYGAKVFVEEWKGFAKQKNSAIEKCTKEWILSLDADEEVSARLKTFIDWAIGAAVGRDFDPRYFDAFTQAAGYSMPRRNLFLGKFIKHGGFYPDRKLRLFRQGKGRVQDAPVHETLIVDGELGGFWTDLDDPIQEPPDLIHHAYPTLSGYIEHMNRYSDLGALMVLERSKGERGASADSREQSARAQSLPTEPSNERHRYSDLGAEMVIERGKVGFSFINIVIRPIATFIYNYFLRLGFLDGREGLLLHLYHSVYVSWKYAKAWEMSSSGERGPKK